MSCAACGSPRLEPHLAVAGPAGAAGLIPTTDAFGTALADIVRCPGCGHMQLAAFPPAEELAEAYGEAASDDYVAEEAGQRETARRVVERIEAWTTPGRILDLGCWVGFLLAEARGRGWEPTGVEPSGWAASYAREELGLDVVGADLFAAPLAERAFRAVVLGDVLEHLIDPGAALRERIAPALAPGGVVCLVLPDAGSRLARVMGARWWSVIPTHVQYFTRGSLRTLLERSGYQVLELRTAPKAFTVRYYLERIGGYSPALARALVAGAKRAGVAERMWAPDFRDRMLVLARPYRAY
jgi:SAM-dependent methyltransferase